MNLSEYGPFGAIIAIVFALAVVFSTLVARAVGRIDQWMPLLTGDTATFLVATGPRAIAVVCIAASFFALTPATRWVFVALALAAAVITYWLVLRFERLRRLHVLEVPQIGSGGSQALNAKGRGQTRLVLIGTEATMLASAKKAFLKARRTNPGLSMTDFLAGFGSTGTYQTAAVWSRETLAEVATRLLSTLTGIVLCGVLALYWAAAIVEVSVRSG